MSGPHVLVVDDNPTNAKLAMYVLQGHGYRVDVVHDAEKARSFLAETLPDAVLMDVQMPGMDGLALTALLRRDERYASLIIIAVTAYAMPEDRARTLDAGCDAHVSKPIDIRELPSLIRRHLDARGRPDDV